MYYKMRFIIIIVLLLLLSQAVLSQKFDVYLDKEEFIFFANYKTIIKVNFDSSYPLPFNNTVNYTIVLNKKGNETFTTQYYSKIQNYSFDDKSDYILLNLSKINETGNYTANLTLIFDFGGIFNFNNLKMQFVANKYRGTYSSFNSRLALEREGSTNTDISENQRQISRKIYPREVLKIKLRESLEPRDIFLLKKEKTDEGIVIINETLGIESLSKKDKIFQIIYNNPRFKEYNYSLTLDGYFFQNTSYLEKGPVWHD